MAYPGFGGVAKLEQYGMHFDELNRIRVLDEDTANQVINLLTLTKQHHFFSKFQYGLQLISKLILPHF